MGPPEQDSVRTKTIKDVAKRVAHLERRRYKDEKEALKKEIKQLKQRDKLIRKKRATSVEQQELRTVDKEYYDTSAMHFM